MPAGANFASTVDLYILRHGKAAPPSARNDDSSRELTPEGRKDIRNAARFLAGKKVRFDGIFTSPLVRARETAEIVAKVTGAREDPVVRDELLPGGNPDAVCLLVSQFGEDATVLIVGHEPLLSALVARIITGGGDAAVALGKGSLAKIRNFTFERSPSGELQWLLSCSQMAEMQ
ncbi:phosphohistidine phosphatase SixA [Methanoregula sp.]|uniref:phosphohistidine phosphatase SixA n=1 Tax=Methanoregula sp. TaxID=2052170 RepID=UPI002CAF5BF3|nr:phosphohistidine phosphatase SixA [Methanoregula sp.]HVP96936.1 phosphohistidine phosphatase SixA [Methanoregula sp.]